MATKISSDAKAVLANANPQAYNYAVSNAPGGKLTSGEAQMLLAQFNANPANVLTAPNIAATNTNPVPRPDDLLGIRKYIGTELGVDAAQTKYNDIYGQLSQFDSATEEQSRKINEQALSTNVLRGQDATATNLRATERSGIARQADVALSSLQALKSEAEAQFNIRQQEVRDKQQLMVQYPGAGIHAGDSFDSITSKLSNYQKQVAKDAKKDALEAKAMEYGIKTKGLSSKEIEKKLKKVNKKAYEDAQKLADIQLRAAELDIKNTLSIISERGKSDKMVPVYSQDPKTGALTQVGTVPSNANITQLSTKNTDDDINIDGLSTEDSGTSGGGLGAWLKGWFN